MKGIFSFRRAFPAGLLIILPLVITLWLVALLFRPVQRFVTPPVVAVLRWVGLGALLEAPGGDAAATLIGLTLTIVLIYLIGVLASNFIGRRVLKGLDDLALGIPFVKSIYGSARQLIETFGSRSRAFEQVVLIQYPRQGLYTVGLVTSETSGEAQQLTAEHLMNVFVPTTPNPTSGVLVMVPRDEVIPLQMSVEEALRLVVSGGIVVPDHKPSQGEKRVRRIGEVPSTFAE